VSCLVPLEASLCGDLDEYLKLLKYEAVDLRRNDGKQLLVDGSVRGKRVEFLVDSGFTLTTLQPASSKGLKPFDPASDTDDKSVWRRVSHSSVVLMDKLRLGRLELVNQPAETRKIDMDYVGFGYGGILGYDFLVRNGCLLDCWQRKLYVRTTGPSTNAANALVETLRRSGFDEAPGTGTLGLLVEVKVNRQPVQMLVDTGATLSVLHESLLKTLSLPIVRWERPSTGSAIPEEITVGIVGSGKIGKQKYRLTRLDTLQIGSRTLQKAHFGVTDLTAWGLANPNSPGGPVMGLLGAEMLAGYGAVIDFASGTLWLRPEKPGSASVASPH
jgi:hypothetical protein